jgi:hypothetical protein
MNDYTDKLYPQYRKTLTAPSDPLEMRVFRALPEDEAREFFDSQLQMYEDLETARQFLSVLNNKILYPVDQYVTTQIQLFIGDEEPDAAERFASLAKRIKQSGGHIEHRDCRERYGHIQHVATLPFGSGRVEYRVLWIEKIDTKGAQQ